MLAFYLKVGWRSCTLAAFNLHEGSYQVGNGVETKQRLAYSYFFTVNFHDQVYVQYLYCIHATKLQQLNISHKNFCC